MSGKNLNASDSGPLPINPLTPAEFAARMAALGPFESAPRVAIACSGGADSLAATLCADHWARAMDGHATALIVDHAMRPDSAAEAAAVAGWLGDRAIDTVILTHRGPQPAADRQAAARRARYALMTGWCRAAGVLHLVLGHHRQDQAETVLLRLARGSGVHGLAGMAPVVEMPDVRLLRPLLDLPRGRLVAFLRSQGQEFVADPSNDDPIYARTRLRRMQPALAAEGMTDTRLAGTARRMARARLALDSAAADLLATTTTIYPQGYARLTPEPLLAAPEEIGLRSLARLLACIGGADYTPRLDRIEALYGWLRAGRGDGRTLGGCRILRRSAGILVCRETSAVAGSVAAVDGAQWDGRFRLRLSGGMPKGARLGPLGDDGWARLCADRPDLRRSRLPAVVRQTLPALSDLDGVARVPHLCYRQEPLPNGPFARAEVVFCPVRPLGGASFAVGANFS